jgi:uncharacterized membrane-anchored protein
VSLPEDHPQRVELNDEAHARPPEVLSAPVRISYLAMVSDTTNRDAERAHIAALAQSFGVSPPGPKAIHYSVDLGRFRLKWERHSEFARYKFIQRGAGEDAFADPPIRAAPEAWVAGIRGRVIVATHAALLAAPAAEPNFETISAR